MSFAKLTTSALAIAAVSASTAAACDQGALAGSFTVLPCASILAEAFGENLDCPTPVVESGGSSAGLKRFCEGVGENTAEGKCMAIRTDGVTIDINGDYTETLARIGSNKDGIGVFGVAFHENNTDKLQLATPSGVVPSIESFSTGEYPSPAHCFLCQESTYRRDPRPQGIC